MMKTKLFTLVCLLFSIAITTQAQNIKITQFDFAEAIKDRQPVGIHTTFPNDIGTVFCYTQIEGIIDSSKITHVWYYKEEEKARVELTVKSNKWRTWSSKSILKNWTGPWRVIVLDPNKNVLASKTFVIADN